MRTPLLVAAGLLGAALAAASSAPACAQVIVQLPGAAVDHREAHEETNAARRDEEHAREDAAAGNYAGAAHDQAEAGHDRAVARRDQVEGDRGSIVIGR